jgi:hypothetical protein
MDRHRRDAGGTAFHKNLGLLRRMLLVLSCIHLPDGSDPREAICIAVSGLIKLSCVTIFLVVVQVYHKYVFCFVVHFGSNVAAAGTLGYVGVSRGALGVPFVNPYHLYTFRNPAIIGGAVYGAIGGAMALFEGKTM